jgi:dTDP-4-amino-4,6-dideoxygalactose transaminase
MTMGIGPGDEALVPGYTFIATAITPLAVGAIPVLVEVDETLTIDPKDIIKKLRQKPKLSFRFILTGCRVIWTLYIYIDPDMELEMTKIQGNLLLEMLK